MSFAGSCVLLAGGWPLSSLSECWLVPLSEPFPAFLPIAGCGECGEFFQPIALSFFGSFPCNSSVEISFRAWLEELPALPATTRQTLILS